MPCAAPPEMDNKGLTVGAAQVYFVPIGIFCGAKLKAVLLQLLVI